MTGQVVQTTCQEDLNRATSPTCELEELPGATNRTHPRRWITSAGRMQLSSMSARSGRLSTTAFPAASAGATAIPGHNDGPVTRNDSADDAVRLWWITLMSFNIDTGVRAVSLIHEARVVAEEALELRRMHRDWP